MQEFSAYLFGLSRRFLSVRFYAAALFNAMFAVLSSVTLLGIVFITKPNQVMHNVQPFMWVPLLWLMLPSQAFSQWMTWLTIKRGQVPSPLAIAQNYFPPERFWRPGMTLVWFLNFVVGFVIVVSLYEPNPKNALQLSEILLIVCVAFALTSFANVYLMFMVRTATRNEQILKRVWDYRVFIDLAAAITGVLYYRIAM